MSFNSPLTTPPSEAERAAPLRIVTARRALPSQRAIAGGVLVTLAVIGTYVSASGAVGDDKTPVVVASHDLPPGTRLTAADFKIERIELPSDLSHHVAHEPSRLVGTITLGPTSAGELLQSGNVEASSAPGQPQLSIAIAAARALGGNLRAGDRVDVVSTDKTSASLTRTAVTNALVLNVAQGSTAVGRNGDVTVTFALATRDEAVELAAANDQGQLTLVRTTGVASVSTTTASPPAVTTTTVVVPSPNPMVGP